MLGAHGRVGNEEISKEGIEVKRTFVLLGRLRLGAVGSGLPEDLAGGCGGHSGISTRWTGGILGELTVNSKDGGGELSSVRLVVLGPEVGLAVDEGSSVAQVHELEYSVIPGSVELTPSQSSECAQWRVRTRRQSATS